MHVLRGRATLVIVLLLAAVLLLANLGNQYLWQDEAQTALIAGTVLTHGIPLGHDGKNSFSQDQGKDYGKNYVWLWHPWLSFYVLAAFFALLGKTTFIARLPFALFGIATVVLTYRFGESLWQSRRAGFFAAMALLLNVPFLLLARQCRYYAPGMFFALLAIYGYCGLLDRRRYSGFIFSLSAIALFHTHYVHYAALLAAVVAHAILFHRAMLRSVLIAVGVTVLANTPWIIWFSAMAKIVGGYEDTGPRALGFAQQYMEMIGNYVFPPLLLLAPLALFAIAFSRWKKPQFMTAVLWQKVVLLLFFGAATVSAISLTSTYPFFRFIAPIIPVACLLIGLVLDRVAAVHRIAGAVVSILILAALGQAWSVPDYLYEVTHDFDGPVEGIVKYLQEHAGEDDVVAITYDDLPVKFYTGLRVVGGLTGEDLTPAETADWIIIRKNIIGKDFEVRNFLLFKVPFDKYDAMPIDYPDTPFENREELSQHLFRTAKDDPVIIFRKRDSS